MAKADAALLAYPVRLEPEPEGAFTVSFPDFCSATQPGGGGYSFGATREEALHQAADRLETIARLREPLR